MALKKTQLIFDKQIQSDYRVNNLTNSAFNCTNYKLTALLVKIC